mgnify:CR=1 FL=1
MHSIQQYQEFVLEFLNAQQQEREPKNLYEPIRYILGLGGKKMRPVLTLMSAEIFDADYVKENSGFSIGGVAPIGWINTPSITLIDEALNDYEVVWAAAGHPHAVFPTSYSELLSCTEAKSMLVGMVSK